MQKIPDTSSVPVIVAIKELEKSFTRCCTDGDLSFRSNKPKVKIDYVMYSKKSDIKVKSQRVISNAQIKGVSDHLP